MNPFSDTLLEIENEINRLAIDRPLAVESQDFERACLRKLQVERLLLLQHAIFRLGEKPMPEDGHSLKALVSDVLNQPDAQAEQDFTSVWQKLNKVLDINLLGK